MCDINYYNVNYEGGQVMNAGIRGTMFVKADRINHRIDEITRNTLNTMEEYNKKTLSKTDLLDIIKTIHIIVDTELSEKGVDRAWKK